MTTALHPDWGGSDTPAQDFTYAFEAYPRWGKAEPTSPELPETERFTATDVTEITRYHVSYHDETPWAPGRTTGTELSMSVVGRLKDGRWFCLEAWNDYTGWGCQDGADIRVAATEEQVVRFGLSSSAREALGYTSPPR